MLGTKSTTNTNSFKFHTTSKSTDTIIIPFHTGENRSKDRVNKLAQMVEQKCKLRQSGSEVHALKYKVMLPLIII